jgi:serine protease Do
MAPAGRSEPETSTVHTGAPAFADVAERSKPAVVNVSTTQTLRIPKGGPLSEEGEESEDPTLGLGPSLPGLPHDLKRRSLGSGFLISPDGLIVTNHHLVADADKIIVRPASGDGDSGDREYPAKIVGSDSKTDLALLKIDAREEVPSLTLGDSSRMRVGDWVIAIGNPFGLNQTVTAGIVSATGRVIGQGPYDDFIQTDASINPGNSGGPLLNLDGEVVGISVAIVSGSGGNLGIGFATPSRLASGVINQLRSGGKVVRGWLGVTVQPITPELAESLRLPETVRGGVLVSDVKPGGPAAAGGVKRGDLIRSFDGKSVRSWRDFVTAVADAPIGKEAEIRVLRDGKEHPLTVRVDEMPAEAGQRGMEGGLGRW